MKATASADTASYARKIVGLIDGAVNFTVLVALLFLFCFGFYSLWDSKQIYHSASAAEYEIYKPNENNTLSFKQLCGINDDVFGWISVYGTAIDYPLVQGEDNWEYLNKNSEGKYSLTGAIFLDYRNSKELSDYNSIIHGHHMQASAMFGDLDKFSDLEFFGEHRYGSIFYGGRERGIEFFAYILADAYDDGIYRILSADSEQRDTYLESLMQKAAHSRDCGQTAAESIVLLSTCSSEMTNGRSILVGCISDEVYSDPFYTEDADARDKAKVQDAAPPFAASKGVPLWVWLSLLLVIMVLVYAVSNIISVRIRTAISNKSRKKEGNTHEEHQ